MHGIIKVSDAASLALHSMALLAARGNSPMTAAGIAAELKGSRAHLSKVLQRLAQAGLLVSQRGPSGGFMLTPEGRRATLLRVYEAVEGPLRSDACLLHSRLCGGKNCIFGGLLSQLNAEVRRTLTATRVERVTTFCGKEKRRA